MELRRLRLLSELSRRGTIAAVAQALDYSPSSVSVQLSELEREVGARLLERVGRNVRLTSAGTRLVAHAHQALAADEAMLAELSGLSDALRGRLRLTFVQTPALALLPSTLDWFAAHAPELRLEVVHRETAPALDELRSQAVDVVVGVEYDPLPVPRHRDVDRRDLIREDVLLAIAARHPVATHRGPIELARIEHLPWVAGHRGSGHAAVIEHLCNRLGGYAPDIRHRTDDALLLRILVASGTVVTLLPALLGPATPELVFRPIVEGTLRRTIFTAVRSASSDAATILAARQALTAAARAAGSTRSDVTAIDTH